MVQAQLNVTAIIVCLYCFFFLYNGIDTICKDSSYTKKYSRKTVKNVNSDNLSWFTRVVESQLTVLAE